MEKPPAKRRIDIWWRGDATSRLMLLFAHIIRQDTQWEGAKIRVLDICGGVESGKTVGDLGGTLSEFRIAAEPEIIASPSANAVAAYSMDAAMVFLPFRLRQDMPADPFGDPLGGLVRRLPLTAAVLAAEDLDLSAEPEAGEAGDKAAVRDALDNARKKARAAEKAAGEASADAMKKMVEWEKALGNGAAGADTVNRLNRELTDARENETKAARKSAKLAAKVDDLEKTAERMGIEAPENIAGEPAE